MTDMIGFSILCASRNPSSGQNASGQDDGWGKPQRAKARLHSQEEGCQVKSWDGVMLSLRA